MRERTKLLAGIAAMVSYAFLVQWILCFSTLAGDLETVRTPFWVLAAALSLTYAVDSILLKRGVALPIYLILQVLMTALTVYAFVRLVVLVPYSPGTCVFGGGLVGILSLSAAYSAYFPAGRNSLVLRFDLVCAGIIILLLLTKIADIPDLQTVVLCGGVSLVVLLCAVVASSAGAPAGVVHQGHPGRGRLAVVAVGILVVVLAAVIYALGSGALTDASRTLAGILKAVGLFLFGILKWVWDLFIRFMLWLSSLVPDPGAVSAGGTEVSSVTAEAVDYGDFTLPRWLIAIPIAAALALFVFILLHFRRAHLKAGVLLQTGEETRAVRTSGLGRALREALARWKRRLAYLRDRLAYRNTAPGLYDRLCRVSRKNRKRPGESPSRFVRRLSTEETAEEFSTLADALERCFYREEKIPLEKALCRKIRKAARKL